jgi:pyridoxamine 5'-phosphate oxidase family protein
VSAFTGIELAYLTGKRRLGRLATVGRDGLPHIAPVGWSYNAEVETIDVGGHDIARTKKFRDVAHTGLAAIVIDDVLPPWRPRGIEVRGTAEAIARGEAARGEALIRIHPRRIVSWGLESPGVGARYARDIGAAR